MREQTKGGRVGSMIVLIVALLVSGLAIASPVRADLDAVIAEAEPNNTSETAQSLGAIGLSNPVSAQINQAGDNDWYRFSAVEGRTYVVELFNVSSSLGQGSSGFYECAGRYSSFTGLALFAFDPATDSQIAAQCSPNSNGNTLVSITVKAVSNQVRLLVYPQVGGIGAYRMRILPKYDEPGAAWNQSTFEPNDRQENAFLLNVGRTNAVTSAIDAYDSIYANYTGDADWYRFNAVEGRTYVVELFNVSSSLGQGESGFYNCAGRNGYYRGLALFAFDPATNSQITGQCSPNGNGNTLVSITFKATSNQVHLLVYPQVPTTSGRYNLRILPKYGEQGAAWDQSTFEPNDRQENAFLLNMGRTNAVTSGIDARDSIYATSGGDADWYRFNAIQGRTYVVELFNVSASLGQGESGFYNCSGRNGYYRGLALFAFDTVTSSQIAGQCSPNDGGNVLVSIELKAGNTGPITLLVYGQVATASGRYSLRILPKYDEQGAAWDATTFEPNNRAANAYQLGGGRPSSVTSAIIPHDSTLATNWGDADWYRFNATAGETYTVELFNVSASLNARDSGFYNCAGANGYYRGLALFAYDTATDSQITARCRPNTVGNIHSSIEFKAPNTGVVTLLVYPHDIQSSGNYSIRVNAESEQFRVYLPLLSR